MAKLPKLPFATPEEIREFRKKRSMNQSEFWSRVGVTQSGGSRYESGRNVPTPVRILLAVAYAPDGQSAKTVGALRSWKAPAH